MESKPISSSTDRVELSAEHILAHLPQEFDSLLPSAPATSGSTSSGNSINEEELRTIIKAILDLKQEVDRLKRMVETKPSIPDQQIDDAEWQDGENTAANQPVSVKSLKQNNDELYRLALEKHDGKVKNAAAELGVSERTIYRWLDKNKKNA